MKKLFCLLVLISGISNAQIVNIPDANFKAALLNASTSNATASNAYPTTASSFVSIDSNDDGEIQVSEALNVYYLNVYSDGISDLTGIEYFTNLRFLNCGMNDIATLNLSALTYLQELNCQNNNLTVLDVSELTNLIYLSCGMNNLTTLDISALPLLQDLYCYSNDLTTLIVSPINNLMGLQCSQNNFATLDFSMLTHLTFLNCSYNQLTAIDVSMLTDLTQLYCHNNQLTSLDVSALTNLVELTCIYNQLTVLDVSALPNLLELYCYNNNLSTLNLKNGSNETTLQFSGNPNLLYICADEDQLVSVEDKILNYGYVNCHVNTYCSFTPGGNYNTISGNISFDSDQNGCDENDETFPHIRVNINDGTNQEYGFTSASGNYNFYTETGIFTITPAIENPTWFNFTPTTASVAFTDDNNNISDNDFCVSANGVHSDVEVVIEPIMPARPGFDAVYKLVYKNNGNQTETVFVNFNYDGTRLQYVSSSSDPVNAATGSLAWQFSNVMPFESGSILVTLNVNAPTDTPAVNIGDVLAFSSFVDITTDEDWDDNAFDYNQTVVGSYDPNDITCLQGGIVSPVEIGNYLHYAIRFENTGNAAAENIVVRTTVNPTGFDVNSLQLLNASHTVNTRISGNIVEFIFQNIMLESGGHGNVLLKVKSKSNLHQGDMVSKHASIYFDYNLPVETNDFETVFQSLNNPDFEIDNSISIYPNPSNGIVNISSNFNIKSIELFDVQGRLLQTNIVNNNNTTIDISTQSIGVYFVRVVSDKGLKVEKFVKQ